MSAFIAFSAALIVCGFSLATSSRRQREHIRQLMRGESRTAARPLMLAGGGSSESGRTLAAAVGTDYEIHRVERIPVSATARRRVVCAITCRVCSFFGILNSRVDTLGNPALRLSCPMCAREWNGIRINLLRHAGDAETRFQKTVREN